MLRPKVGRPPSLPEPPVKTAKIRLRLPIHFRPNDTHLLIAVAVSVILFTVIGLYLPPLLTQTQLDVDTSTHADIQPSAPVGQVMNIVRVRGNLQAPGAEEAALPLPQRPIDNVDRQQLLSILSRS